MLTLLMTKRKKKLLYRNALNELFQPAFSIDETYESKRKKIIERDCCCKIASRLKHNNNN